MNRLDALTVEIFADGADLSGMLDMYRNPLIKGFTTNPTLMNRAGITDYAGFAREVLEQIADRPISFEVFADEFEEMERQAMEIAGWADNVFVKIPITNSRGESSQELVRILSKAGVRLNVTALLTLNQVERMSDSLAEAPAAFVSVFAGRIADTGLDPVPVMRRAVEHLSDFPNVRLIWASPRELLNVFQADDVGCHVITATNDILRKLDLVGKDLLDYSLETVKMFYEDGLSAGFSLKTSEQSPFH